MTTPHYRAVRTRNGYTLRRVDTGHRVKVASLVGGGVVIGLLGQKRGGLSGLLLTAVGLCTAFYGYTGRDPLAAVACPPTAKPEGSPSYHHEEVSRSEQQAADAIDEAAMESFPASDPPARVGSTMA